MVDHFCGDLCSSILWSFARFRSISVKTTDSKSSNISHNCWCFPLWTEESSSPPLGIWLHIVASRAIDIRSARPLWARIWQGMFDEGIRSHESRYMHARRGYGILSTLSSKTSILNNQIESQEGRNIPKKVANQWSVNGEMVWISIRST